MKYLSLFSGIGGFDLGFDRAGMVCAGQVEYDAAARSVLARHWPDVPRTNDVREVTGHEFGTIDLICGGFPCQDVSVAGRRAGLAGERSGLWYEFHRIIDRVKPGTVVIENVPGLLSSNGGRDFAVILRGLVECGYGVAWRILDAQYFGVPQRRRRVFIVGSLGDGRAAEILFEREGGGGDSPTGGRPGQDTARTIATGSNSNLSDWETETFVTATLNSGGNNGGFRTEPGEHLVMASHPVSPALTNEGHDSSEDGRGRHAFALTFEPYHDEHDGRGANFRPTDSHGALRGPNGTDNALVKIAHGVRRLTPVECERLQGFPDNWTDGQSDSARYRQLGNAVAVPVVEWLARRIVEATP